ncbi:hypothetical protein AJ80_10024 [Polytolypa hystricis UAMH7299]|uniref:Uncharacterized protein n=1 Tax=Polytolypa hystricis (strain UAMH7299) TaxID=1447883 RepID=A0A2B7WEQ8_POLH7|nr:hypothetical protein AJ80_10024 [Polytolypa hystricis UAMH7299]
MSTLPESAYAILAIKPDFVKLIVQSAKNHEFRKYKLAEVQRLWLYESSPISQITHAVTTSTPKTPGEIRDPSSVSNDDFDAGKKASKYGYPVLHLDRLQKPLSIADMKDYGLRPPQGFTYVPSKLAEDLPLDEMVEVF